MFIVVTTTDDKKVGIKIDNIVEFAEVDASEYGEGDGTTTLITIGSRQLCVKDSVDEIAEMIDNCM